MDKLHNLHAEKRAREARLQAEEREKEARLQTEERAARLQAEEREKERSQNTGWRKSSQTTGYRERAREREDDLDMWLLCFERFANTSGWPEENWCTSLSALLTGRALEIFCRLSESEAIDYDKVKEVLQKRYNSTEDGYRQKFRAGTPEDGENPNMFIVLLKTYWERWVKLSERWRLSFNEW